VDVSEFGRVERKNPVINEAEGYGNEQVAGARGNRKRRLKRAG